MLQCTWNKGRGFYLLYNSNIYKHVWIIQKNWIFYRSGLLVRCKCKLACNAIILAIRLNANVMPIRIPICIAFAFLFALLRCSPLKRLYPKEDNHLLIFCVFSTGRNSNISQKYILGNFWEHFKRLRKRSIWGPLAYVANRFFLHSFDYFQKFPGW